MGIELSGTFFLVAFSSLFTIINPLSTASVFVTITRGDTRKKKLQMARKACITAAVVLIIFSLAGSYILNFFSITLHAFQIAGGLIIGGIGFNMLHARRKQFTDKEKEEAVDKEDISIIPLAIPMLSGPGAMTTGLVLMGEALHIGNISLIIVAIVLVCLISYLILSRADVVSKYLGATGRSVIDKIMGLIVLVVGTQFIINGVEGVILQWFPR